MKSRFALALALGVVALAGCDPLPRPPTTPAAAAQRGTAFVDVHVLAPEGDRFIAHQTVIVAPGGRIAWIGDAAKAHLGGAVPIAGRGTAYLVPGSPTCTSTCRIPPPVTPRPRRSSARST